MDTTNFVLTFPMPDHWRERGTLPTWATFGLNPFTCDRFLTIAGSSIDQVSSRYQQLKRQCTQTADNVPMEMVK